MDSIEQSYLLYRLSEHNRSLAADHLIKSTLPNAKELCTGNLDFKQVLNKLNKQNTYGLGKLDIEDLLRRNTETVRVSRSPRLASAELAQAYQINVAMIRLLNHSIKQKKSVLDNFRPGG